MNLENFKTALYKERQAVDALATTVKSNTASIMAIIAAVAIPFVPALFAANGVYVQTVKWSESWRIWAAIATAVAIEGAGMFLSILATKTYSAWRKRAASPKEVWAMGLAVGLYTIIVIVLISFSDIPTGLKFTIALIPLLGVAFYIGMGFETDLANRLDEAAAEKRQKQEERRAARVSKNRPIDRPNSVQKTVSKEEAIAVILQFLADNPDASLSEIGRQIGRPKSTTGNYVNELMGKGQLKKNGHGWEINGKPHQ